MAKSQKNPVGRRGFLKSAAAGAAALATTEITTSAIAEAQRENSGAVPRPSQVCPHPRRSNSRARRATFVRRQRFG